MRTTERVLITGASSGIGEAAAYRFAREKARLALVARRRDRLERVAERVRSLGGEALVVEADVSSPLAARDAVAYAGRAWGGLDVLVVNAGFGIYAPLEAVRPEDLERVFAVNTFGALYFMQAVLPGMKERGAGTILLVSSVVGKRALPMTGAYAATKFALQAFAESLRLELRGTGVRVSVICPAYTATEFGEAAIDYGYPRTTPRGEVTSAEEVAEVILSCARRPRREVILTGKGRLFVRLSRWFPALTDRLLARYLRPVPPVRESRS